MSTKPPLAVALRYTSPSAPRIVASGRGETGQRIIDTARAHDVPLQQNAPLAESLSRVAVDDEIPETLYRAVAQVLAFILRASGRLN